METRDSILCLQSERWCTPTLHPPPQGKPWGACRSTRTIHALGLGWRPEAKGIGTSQRSRSSNLHRL